MQETASPKAKRPHDQKLNILILQIITVVIIMLFAAGIRIFGGGVYNKLSLWYHEKFDDITLTSEVLDPDGKSDSTDRNDNVSNSDDAENTVSQDDAAADGTQSDESTEALPEDEVEGSVKGYISDYDTAKSSMTVKASNNTFLWPVSGRITSEYGYRTHPITGLYSMHGGIDIAAVTGTEIKSAYGGIITDTGYSNSYGYYVTITHNDNLQTLYAHCSEIIASEGEVVGKGETIALVGSTGRSTGSHLHFEIRIGGCRVNPRWLLGETASV